MFAIAGWGEAPSSKKEICCFQQQHRGKDAVVLTFKKQLFHYQRDPSMFTEHTLLSKSGNYPVTVLPCCLGTICYAEPAFLGHSDINAVQLTESRKHSLVGSQLGAGSRTADKGWEGKDCF